MLTTAIADVISPGGTQERLVGSSRRTLNAAQRAALKSGEIPVAGPGHAEITVLNAAKLRSQTVRAVVSSRPPCARCAEAIKAAGAKLIESTKDEQL